MWGKSGASRPLSYPTMTIEAIKSLPVSDVCAKDAHLYLWTINAYVEQSYAVARAWGFEPSTLLTWVKAPKGCGLGGAYAIASEWCLFCRRGRHPHKKRVERNWWGWTRPYDGIKSLHSAKPQEMQAMIETVSDGPYLELFARRSRPGWTVWGNEVEANTERHAPSGAR